MWVYSCRAQSVWTFKTFNKRKYIQIHSHINTTYLVSKWYQNIHHTFHDFSGTLYKCSKQSKYLFYNNLNRASLNIVIFMGCFIREMLSKCCLVRILYSLVLIVRAFALHQIRHHHVSCFSRRWDNRVYLEVMSEIQHISWTYITVLFCFTVFIWLILSGYVWSINTLRPRQNYRHFADDIFKCISISQNFWILKRNSMK